MLRTRGVFPAQSRRNKVGVCFGGIRRGEYLDVGIARVRRAAVDKVAVVQHKIYVRYYRKQEPSQGSANQRTNRGELSGLLTECHAQDPIDGRVFCRRDY